ncbi:hypothetical protein ACFY1B_31680 [Streptomyces mirabilis]|uniref:hypothetical protein n=1 Tax=Streptomyces mirabilis TaxID=68239 RepID=UPI0036BE8695
MLRSDALPYRGVRGEPAAYAGLGGERRADGVRAYLESMWGDSLDALAAIAEQAEREEEQK